MFAKVHVLGFPVKKGKLARKIMVLHICKQERLGIKISGTIFLKVVYIYKFKAHLCK